MRERRCEPNPGTVARGLAVMQATRDDCLADPRSLRDQESSFGSVASVPAVFRVIGALAQDPELLRPCAWPGPRPASGPGLLAPGWKKT